MSRNVTRTLLNNATATGGGESWPGWRGALTVEGAFNGATVRLQFRSRNGTWIDLDPINASFTAPGMCVFECPPGDIRAAVTGGSPSALFAYVISTDPA